MEKEIELADQVIAKAEILLGEELTPAEKALVKFTATQIYLGLVK